MTRARDNPSAGFVQEVEELLSIHPDDAPVACAVDDRLVIRWTSPGWDRRARQVPALTQPLVVGRSLLEGIMPPLHAFYRAELLRTLSEGELWRHEYLGPTRDRLMVCLLTVHPLKRHRGLLLVHAQIFARPHEKVVAEPDIERYLDARGTMQVCGSCRVVQRQDDPQAWDFLPTLLEPHDPIPTAWTLCPSCAVHYERLGDAAEGPRSQRPRATAEPVDHNLPTGPTGK